MGATIPEKTPDTVIQTRTPGSEEGSEVHHKTKVQEKEPNLSYSKADGNNNNDDEPVTVGFKPTLPVGTGDQPTETSFDNLNSPPGDMTKDWKDIVKDAADKAGLGEYVTENGGLNFAGIFNQFNNKNISSEQLIVLVIGLLQDVKGQIQQSTLDKMDAQQQDRKALNLDHLKNIQEQAAQAEKSKKGGAFGKILGAIAVVFTAPLAVVGGPLGAVVFAATLALYVDSLTGDNIMKGLAKAIQEIPGVDEQTAMIIATVLVTVIMVVASMGAGAGGAAGSADDIASLAARTSDDLAATAGKLSRSVDDLARQAGKWYDDAVKGAKLADDAPAALKGAAKNVDDAITHLKKATDKFDEAKLALKKNPADKKLLDDLNKATDELTESLGDYATKRQELLTEIKNLDDAPEKWVKLVNRATHNNDGLIGANLTKKFDDLRQWQQKLLNLDEKGALDLVRKAGNYGNLVVETAQTSLQAYQAWNEKLLDDLQADGTDIQALIQALDQIITMLLEMLETLNGEKASSQDTMTTILKHNGETEKDRAAKTV